MWATDWDSSAHARLHSGYRRVMLASAFLTLGLAALCAGFAPPYVPAPYAPREVWRPLPPPVPEVYVPAKPAALTETPESFPGEVVIDPNAPDDVPPVLVGNPFDGPRPTAVRPSPAPIVPDVMPVLVHAAEVEYPPLAAQMGAEGWVYVLVLVDELGRVADARVTRSDTIAALEIAALEAARGYLFQPAMQGRVPVPCRIEIPFEFRMD